MIRRRDQVLPCVLCGARVSLRTLRDMPDGPEFFRPADSNGWICTSVAASGQFALHAMCGGCAQGLERLSPDRSLS